MAEQVLGWVEVRSTAHIVVDGQPMDVNETREVNLDTADNRQLVRFGLLEIMDEEVRKALPPTRGTNAPTGGCGCGS